MGIYTGLRSARWSLVGYPAGTYGRVLETSENWSREQIEQYRNEKLRCLITHCYEKVPYYRQVMREKKLRPEDIRSAEDLHKLPHLTKEIIRNRGKELIANNVSQMKVSWNRSGGTTGEPMRVCLNKEAKAWAAMCFERGLKWGGLTPEAPRIQLFGGTLGLSKRGLAQRIGDKLRRAVFLPAFELRSDTANSYFDSIQQSECRFLLGYSSAIYRLAALAQEMDRKLEFEAVFPTAELLMPQWEELIRKTFRCAILPYYGCGEINSLGFHTRASHAYLIPEEHALIEVMKSDGSTQSFGEGRFLITDFDNYAMPIIRYVNGDAGKISEPNGRWPFNRIDRLDGRYNSLLMTDTGDLISGAIGPHVFRDMQSVKTYQIIQEEPLRMVIKIVPKVDLSEKDKSLIINLFSRHLGSRMRIAVEVVSDIPLPPSGKSVFVLNRCL